MSIKKPSLQQGRASLDTGTLEQHLPTTHDTGEPDTPDTPDMPDQ